MDTKKLALIGFACFILGDFEATMRTRSILKNMHERLQARKDKEKFVEMSLNELINSLRTEFPTQEAQQSLTKFQNDMEFIQNLYG